MLTAHIPELQYLKAVSNLAGVLPIARCVRRKLYIEGVVITLAYVVSFIFHFSYITRWDVLLPLQKWHFLDRSFICITSTVIVLYLMEIKNVKYKSALQVLLSLLILAVGLRYFLEIWMIASLWLILVAAITANIAYQETPLCYDGREAVPGVALLAIAALCGLAPLVFGNHTYWFFRSVWHVCSAGSIYFLLGTRNRSSASPYPE